MTSAAPHRSDRAYSCEDEGFPDSPGIYPGRGDMYASDGEAKRLEELGLRIVFIGSAKTDEIV